MLLSSQFLPFAEHSNVALKKGMVIFHPQDLKRGNFWGTDKIVEPNLVSSVHAAETSFHETWGGWKHRFLFIGDFVYSIVHINALTGVHLKMKTRCTLDTGR